MRFLENDEARIMTRMSTKADSVRVVFSDRPCRRGGRVANDRIPLMTVTGAEGAPNSLLRLLPVVANIHARPAPHCQRRRELLRRALPDVKLRAQDRKPGRDDRDFVKIPMSGTTRELA